MELVRENDLIQSLQLLINTYMDKNPQLTLNALSGRANVPVTTLRRLAQGQQKSEIAPHSVLNITSYILREKNLKTILEKVDPCIGEFLKKHFGNFIFSSGATSYSCDLNIELKDQMKYFIYKLAANHNGTELITIVENFGAYGRKKAEEMKASGLLIERDSRLHAREKNFSLDLQVAADHLPELAKLYKPDTIALGRNSFFSLSESLTFEAIQKIKAAQRECVKKISEIMNDNSSMGDIPYFTLNLSETMTSEVQPGDLQ